MWKKQKIFNSLKRPKVFKALWYNNNNDTKKAIGKKKQEGDWICSWNNNIGESI